MITAIKNDYSDRDPLTAKIISACYQVHRELGPGFIERIYLNAVKIALKKLGLNYEEQKEFSVSYQGQKIGRFRIDLIVENKVIVELKSVEHIIPVHKKQLLTYLRLADKRLGLLINFGSELIRDGISKVVNRLNE